MEPQQHFVRRADGRLEDTRYRYAREDRVRIMAGPYLGRVGTVESRVGQFHDEGRLVNDPGYQVRLDDEGWVTVRWDAVEPLGECSYNEGLNCSRRRETGLRAWIDG